MAAEGAIIGGLGVIAGLLAYLSIQFYIVSGDNAFVQKLSLGLSMFSFLFMALIMFFVHAIAVSQAAYLSTKLTVISVKIMLWFVQLVSAGIALYIIFAVVLGFVKLGIKLFGKEKRKEDRDGS